MTAPVDHEYIELIPTVTNDQITLTVYSQYSINLSFMSNPPLQREDAVYKYTYILRSGEDKWEQMEYKGGYKYQRLDNTVRFSTKNSFALPSDLSGEFNMVAKK